MSSKHFIPSIHRTLRKFIFKFYSKGAIFLIIAMIVEGLISLEDTKDKPLVYNILGHITAIVTIALFLIAIILKYSLKFIRLDGSGVLRKLRSYNIQILTENAFIRVEDILTMSTSFVNDNSGKYVFANSEELAIHTGIINFEAFRSSPWHDNSNEKIKRNLSHSNRNHHSLMLIRSNPGAERMHWIGFTHILPVNYTTWKRYTDGLINDNDFQANDICPTDSQDVYGLIVFSVASDTQAITYAKSNNDPVEYNSLLIFQALTFHLNKLIEQHFSSKEAVYLLLQTEREYYKRICKENRFRLLKNPSADGCAMFEAKITLQG